MASKVVAISSAIFNVFNFILFDIILASLVFYFTADIAGLVNSASALQQLGNRLHAYNPPLVGVGLTCTRPTVFRVLALVRGLAMLLVLSTNFLIEGASAPFVEKRNATVVVAGSIPREYNQVRIRQLTLRRRGCQDRKDDFVYYGELRVGAECELRRQFMTAKTVEFGLKFENRTTNLKNCEFSTRDHVHAWICENGVVGCLTHETVANRTNEESCQGTVLLKTPNGKFETYMCQGAGMFPPKTSRIARCRLARGADYLNTAWVPFIGWKVRTLRDAIDAVYAAGEENMTVKAVHPEKRVSITEIDLAWFYILGVKGLTILVLVVVDLVLRSRGYVRAANDEFGIGSLLARSAAAAGNIVGQEERLPVAQDPEFANAPDYGSGRARADNRPPRLLVQNEGGVLRARAS